MTLRTCNQQEKLDYSINVLNILKSQVKTWYLNQHKSVRQELPVLLAVLDSQFSQLTILLSSCAISAISQKMNKSRKVFECHLPWPFSSILALKPDKVHTMEHRSPPSRFPLVFFSELIQQMSLVLGRPPTDS